MINKTSYTIKEIANWQLEANEDNIQLPALQRGFVWKPNQIETLWDSLLRGFPIGSFLMSYSGKNLFLLDGQQRATSITLGYYNPWKENEKKFWSLKKVPILWIDLDPQNDKTANQKFSPRLLTQSHPWGYQASDNTKKLSVGDRNSALDIFKKNQSDENAEAYIDFDLRKCYPFASRLPVPISFLFEAIDSGENSWKQTLVKLCSKYLDNYVTHTLFNDFKGGLLSSQIKKLLLTDDGDDFFKIFQNCKEINIPSIKVDKAILNENDHSENSEDPTLFVRLNSAGTRIAGEELIYSIYKAAFPQTKDLVEKISLGFMRPSLVISLSARLITSEINANKYPNPIGVNDFRKKVEDSKFTESLKGFIGDSEKSPAEYLFKDAINALQSESYLNMPPVLIKSMINRSSDLFLMLLQWLRLNKDVDRKKILRFYSAILWFGRDHKNLVIEAWNFLDKSDFWNGKDLSSYLYKNNDFKVYPFIKPDLLRDYLINTVVKEHKNWEELYPVDGSEIIQFYEKVIYSTYGINDRKVVLDKFKDIWNPLLIEICWNKQLLLFAQRNYIVDKFKSFNQIENLEDTNVPWDFDHIYPWNWVQNKKGVDINVRHWANSNGNFRLLALEDNRSESDHLSPFKRLIKPKIVENSFIKKNDLVYWSKIKNRVYSNIDESNVQNLLSAIIHRYCNIYEEWYNTLEIEGLFYNPQLEN